MANVTIEQLDLMTLDSAESLKESLIFPLAYYGSDGKAYHLDALSLEKVMNASVDWSKPQEADNMFFRTTEGEGFNSFSVVSDKVVLGNSSSKIDIGSASARIDVTADRIDMSNTDSLLLSDRFDVLSNGAISFSSQTLSFITVTSIGNPGIIFTSNALDFSRITEKMIFPANRPPDFYVNPPWGGSFFEQVRTKEIELVAPVGETPTMIAYAADISFYPNTVLNFYHDVEALFSPGSWMKFYGQFEFLPNSHLEGVDSTHRYRNSVLNYHDCAMDFTGSTITGFAITPEVDWSLSVASYYGFYGIGSDESTKTRSSEFRVLSDHVVLDTSVLDVSAYQVKTIAASISDAVTHSGQLSLVRFAGTDYARSDVPYNSFPLNSLVVGRYKGGPLSQLTEYDSEVDGDKIKIISNQVCYLSFDVSADVIGSATGTSESLFYGGFYPACPGVYFVKFESVWFPFKPAVDASGAMSFYGRASFGTNDNPENPGFGTFSTLADKYVGEFVGVDQFGYYPDDNLSNPYRPFQRPLDLSMIWRVSAIDMQDETKNKLFLQLQGGCDHAPVDKELKSVFGQMNYSVHRIA